MGKKIKVVLYLRNIIHSKKDYYDQTDSFRGVFSDNNLYNLDF
jgi:hypothetical protein